MPRAVKKREDVLGVGVIMNIESAEQGYNQNAETVVGRIVWLMGDVRS